ncbi:hypothetical protein [Flavicella sediminum]|uniref:hypothetical protein n=1 Tax=Flavicella sediminum TaxID=2585141 RepID=UPI00111DDE6D|nr:hypothetical protein [Flavicella sediminum]
MIYKRTNRKIIALLIVSVMSMLIISDFDLTKILQLKGVAGNYYLPVPIVFPVLFLFLYLNLHYIKFSFAEGKTIAQKIFFGLLNFAITIFIFVVGFKFWKHTSGDVDVAFFGEAKDAFELTFRNIFFWTFYQTLMMAYGLSILKIMVSRLPKK